MAILIMSLIAKRFEENAKPYTAEEISEECQIPIRLTHQILYELQEINLLHEVVDENNEIRQYLKSKLATIYNVFDCDNGHEALEIIHRREIDLVISDVMMPVMDGIELCKAIKSNIEINHIPVILLTAHVSDTHVKDGLSSGANDYVFKPFNFDLLLARIQNLLDNNERLRQSFQKRISPKDTHS